MENNKQEPAKEQSAGANPTLDSPGSQVADYGNTTGGSADEGLPVQTSTDKAETFPGGGTGKENTDADRQQ